MAEIISVLLAYRTEYSIFVLIFSSTCLCTYSRYAVSSNKKFLSFISNVFLPLEIGHIEFLINRSIVPALSVDPTVGISLNRRPMFDYFSYL